MAQYYSGPSHGIPSGNVHYSDDRPVGNSYGEFPNQSTYNPPSSSYSAQPAYSGVYTPQYPSTTQPFLPVSPNMATSSPYHAAPEVVSSETRGRSRHPGPVFTPQSHFPSEQNQHQYNSYDNSHGMSLLNRIMSLVSRNKPARNLFNMAVASFILALVQMTWSLIISNRTLFTTAFGALYNFINLGMVFMMNIVSKEKTTSKASYGYNRLEVVAAFSNGALLTFLALYGMFESFEGLIEGHQASVGSGLMIMGVLGLFVQATAVAFFSDHLSPRTEASTTRETRNNSEAKTKAMIAHCMPNLLVIFAGFSQSSFADSIFSLALSFHQFYIAVPLCYYSGRVLLQSVPRTLEDLLEKSVRDVESLPGVVQVKRNKTHFWTYSPGVHVGTVIVLVNDEVDEQWVTASCTKILSPFIHHLTVQVERASAHNHHSSHDHSSHNHSTHDHSTHDQSSHNHSSHNHSSHDHASHDHTDHHHDHDQHDHHDHDHNHHGHTHDHNNTNQTTRNPVYSPTQSYGYPSTSPVPSFNTNPTVNQLQSYGGAAQAGTRSHSNGHQENSGRHDDGHHHEPHNHGPAIQQDRPVVANQYQNYNPYQPQQYSSQPAGSPPYNI